MNNKTRPEKLAFAKIHTTLFLLPFMCLLSYVAVGANTVNAADVVSGRTIKIVMDKLEFEPKSIDARAGETIRFVLHNRGDISHDFTIGTPVMQQARRSFIMVLQTADELDPEGKGSHSHDHPNSVIIPPGQTKELVWNFKTTRSVEFGCNIPLHYESGMRGKFEFSKPVASINFSE